MQVTDHPYPPVFSTTSSFTGVKRRNEQQQMPHTLNVTSSSRAAAAPLLPVSGQRSDEDHIFILKNQI